MCLERHGVPTINNEVDGFLKAVPDGLCRSIAEAVMRIHVLGCFRGFAVTVGEEHEFHLKDPW